VCCIGQGLSDPFFSHEHMAPSKSLQKLLKIKPVKPVSLDPEEKPVIEKLPTSITLPEAVVLPPVTEQERQKWAAARALQRVDERGQPVEGWARRLATMEADGRLYRIGNTLHQRAA
jgi:hypothetical protein